jgi:hypothetical protein
MKLLDQLIRFLGIPQNTDDFKWTQTQAYRNRMEWVKNFWIVGGVVMIIAASPAFILVSSFFLTFLSFAFLEKP